MLTNNENRVIKDLEEWKQMESKWRDLLGPDVLKQREFMEERLRYLKDIPKKYAGRGMGLSKEEKTALKLIKGEISRMEKVLYPNPIVRAVVKIIEAVKTAVESVNRQRNPTYEWKSVLSPRSPKKDIRIDNSSQQKEVSNKSAKVVDVRGAKKGPDRELNGNKRIDDEPLLVKLKTGEGKGLKKN